MREVVIVGMARTPIGSFGGTLKPLLANELGVIAVKEAIRRSGLQDLSLIDDVLIGNCMMRTDEINVARVIGLKSGIPFTTPAATIQRQCASGMQAAIFGAQKIQLGEDDLVVVGGCESMSNVPYVLKDMRWGARQFDVKATDALFEGLTDPVNGLIMGLTAENLAEKYNISREEQDALALVSQQRALQAIDNGWFKEEIVPVPVPQRKGEPAPFTTDEHPRRGTTMETLAALKPAFKKGGTVTAGNASGLNDGGAAMVLASLEKAKELGLKPIARIVAHAVAAVEPELMGYGPVPAIKKLFKRTGLTLNDIDLLEVNEAFAAQYLACEKLLELDRSKVNISGSGIALGHPVGATGVRIIITLIHHLKRLGKKRGIATLCVGGGMGKATVVEMM
ncbi:MAG: thiolase family protein [Myxococcales bacterium]|nr:MAG: thiolase family protein [Myxococcales bacterium]